MGTLIGSGEYVFDLEGNGVFRVVIVFRGIFIDTCGLKPGGQVPGEGTGQSRADFVPGFGFAVMVDIQFVIGQK